MNKSINLSNRIEDQQTLNIKGLIIQISKLKTNNNVINNIYANTIANKAISIIILHLNEIRFDDFISKQSKKLKPTNKTRVSNDDTKKEYPLLTILAK